MHPLLSSSLSMIRNVFLAIVSGSFLDQYIDYFERYTKMPLVVRTVVQLTIGYFFIKFINTEFPVFGLGKVTDDMFFISIFLAVQTSLFTRINDTTHSVIATTT